MFKARKTQKTPKSTDIKPTVDSIVNTISTNFDFSHGLKLQDLSKIVAECMSIVGKAKSLESHEKKELVLKVIQKMMEGMEGEQYINMILPSLIDIMISIENGEIKLNENVKNTVMFGINLCCAAPKTQ